MTASPLAEAFWDLRDDAYDFPDHWERLAPVDVFQRIAELLEAAEVRGELDWRRDVVLALVSPRSRMRPS